MTLPELLSPGAGVVDRLRQLVVRSYTRHTVTRGGIVKAKRAKQVEIESAVARELVAFAVDYGVVQGFRTPEGLWSALLQEAIESGELVRPENASQLQHRLDHQLDR